jgi:hypothetical protein
VKRRNFVPGVGLYFSIWDRERGEGIIGLKGEGDERRGGRETYQSMY